MKKAFTLLELLLVIVVVGILAVFIVPSFKDTILRQAADQVANHIRYAQHLSMISDQYSSSESAQAWQRKRWSVAFSNSKAVKSGGKDECIGDYDKCWRYSVFHDLTASETKREVNNKDEIAINPINPSIRLTGGWSGMGSTDDRKIVSRDMILQRRYGVDNIDFSGSCKATTGSGTTITFDEVGQIYVNTSVSPTLITSDKGDCEITLHRGDETCKISITPITGYVKISGC